MAIVVDSENVVSSLETAPDRLRAEIGSYYLGDPDQPSQFANFRSGIKSEMIDTNVTQGSYQLVPTQKARIFISGRDEQFRDQIQWNDYVKQTIRTGVAFLDHQFS